MKLKKLGFMNIKREDILSRSEMRSVLAGSGGNGGTNCVICPWDIYCICWSCFPTNPPPPVGCSYGHCGSMC